MRGHLRTLSMAVATALAAAAWLAPVGVAHAQKLYRWVDEEGKVHYSDQLPPEAVKQAREELNQQGLAVKRVDRAMTEEERAALDAERARAAEEAAALEEAEKRDHVLLASYTSESDLERAYRERFDLLEQSVATARMGIESQEESLASLLEHAAQLERSGKPVPDTVAQSIAIARKRVEEQRSYLTRREAERVALSEEYEQILARYRELRAQDSGDS